MKWWQMFLLSGWGVVTFLAGVLVGEKVARRYKSWRHWDER